MCFGATRGYEFVSDFLRKGNVNEVITVDVADFSPPQAIFCASKAVWLGCDPRPALHHLIDSLFSFRDWQRMPLANLVSFLLYPIGCEWPGRGSKFAQKEKEAAEGGREGAKVVP